MQLPQSHADPLTNSPRGNPGACFPSWSNAQLCSGPCGPTSWALSLVPGGLVSTWGLGTGPSLGPPRPRAHLAGVLLALSEARTQHVVFDGSGLEARLRILAVEQVALGCADDGHGELLQGPGFGQAVCGGEIQGVAQGTVSPWAPGPASQEPQLCPTCFSLVFLDLLFWLEALWDRVPSSRLPPTRPGSFCSLWLCCPLPIPTPPI